MIILKLRHLFVACPKHPHRQMVRLENCHLGISVPISISEGDKFKCLNWRYHVSTDLRIEEPLQFSPKLLCCLLGLPWCLEPGSGSSTLITRRLFLGNFARAWPQQSDCEAMPDWTVCLEGGSLKLYNHGEGPSTAFTFYTLSEIIQLQTSQRFVSSSHTWVCE